MPDRKRMRKIVKLAAERTETDLIKDWLTRDERGTWEKMAQDLLEKTADAAKSLGMTEDQVDDEISTAILLSALTAASQ